MATPHIQMVGRTYHITYHEDHSLTVDCTYLCPYCDQDTTSRFEADADMADTLESGMFANYLRCDLCGKISNVTFVPSNRI